MTGTGAGVVRGVWRYPVKSMQGLPEAALEIGPAGVAGDRAWGLLDVATGRLASAKRFSALLHAAGGDEAVTLPDGTAVALADPGAAEVLGRWLGREVRVLRPGEAAGLAYQMTFDPPNDDAELVDIPVPAGTLVDLAAVHLVAAGTLDDCARRWPALDWEVRRFRPNLLVDTGAEPFAEHRWAGRELHAGSAVLRVDMPTVRCAMPLRAQPGLDAQPALFAALDEADPAHPNHLGLYLSVVRPGRVAVGDTLTLA